MSKPRTLCDKPWNASHIRLLGCAVGIVTIFQIAVVAAEPPLFDVAQAEAAFDQRTGEPIVTYRFTPESAGKFAEFTLRNVGHPAEMRVDGRVRARPVIREPILQGSGQIWGHLSKREAEDIAARLSAGTRLEIEAMSD